MSPCYDSSHTTWRHMMTPETLEVLKNYSSINKSILIKPGNVITIFNESIGLFSHAKVADTFPVEVPVYELSELLSTLSLFESPNIKFDSDKMVIRGNETKVNYKYSSPDVIIGQLFDIPEAPPFMFKLSLTKEKIHDILRAASVMKLKEIEFTSSKIKVYNSNQDGEVIGHEYTINLDNVEIGEDHEDDNQSIKINVQAMKMLPLDYIVEVSDACVKFENNERNISYFAALLQDD